MTNEPTERIDELEGIETQLKQARQKVLELLERKSRILYEQKAKQSGLRLKKGIVTKEE